MDYTTVDRIVGDALRFEEQKRVENEAEKRLRYIKDFGSDSYGEGTVIRFKKKYPSTDIEYTYAVIKADGNWYTTGPQGRQYTWEAFLAWLVSGDKPTTKIEVLTNSYNIDAAAGEVRPVQTVDQKIPVKEYRTDERGPGRGSLFDEPVIKKFDKNLSNAEIREAERVHWAPDDSSPF